jgi:protein involved in temperature-dependent protein secretion
MENIPSVSGKLTFRDGRVREFKSIVDSDNGIGAMLETYGPSGLMYLPFAALRSLTFLPPRNFIDRLVPRAEAVLGDGTSTTVLVPLLYALSTTDGDASIRAGRMTTWRYVGPARRGLGQRDFVLDGGVTIGMQNVAAIELTGASAGARPSPAARPGARAPLPRATAEPSAGESKSNLLVIGLVLVAIVVILILALG